MQTEVQNSHAVLRWCSGCVTTAGGRSTGRKPFGGSRIARTLADVNAEDEIRRHIAPEMSKRLLTIAGVYLVAYELVKSTVVNEVRGFYTMGRATGSGWLIHDQYEQEVRAPHKYELDGCLAWLVSRHALTQDEADSVGRLRDARNRVAHDVAELLVEPRLELDLQPAHPAWRPSSGTGVLERLRR